MKVGCGVSDFSDPKARAKQASDLAMGDSRAVRAHTALVFTQAETTQEYLDALSAVKQVTGAENVLGASAIGVLSMEREWEEGPSCAVMVFGKEGNEASLETTLLRQGHNFDPRFEQRAHSSIMALGDPGLFNLDAYNAMYRQRRKVVFGGGASSFSDDFPGAPVFFNGNCFREASCAIAFPQDLRLSMGVVYGCRSVSVPLLVTKAKKNLVLELSGRPAVQILEKTLSSVISEIKDGDKENLKDGEEEQPLPLLAGVLTSDQPAMETLPTPSDFYVRPIMAVDPASGGIILGEDVSEGRYITFVLREKEWAHQELEVSLRDLKTGLGSKKPKFGFYFNCAGRGTSLYGEESHDVGLIRKHLGNFPLIGMSSSFELAPQGGHLAIHSFTGVLAVFS